MNTQLHTDVLILAHYIVEDIPKLASHLDRFRLDVTDLLEVFQQWNGALFATHFRSRSFVYRILDLILLGQHRGITAVVYGLLKVNAPRLLELDEFDSIYTAMASLGEPEREDAAGLAAFDACGLPSTASFHPFPVLRLLHSSPPLDLSPTVINLAFEEGYFSVVGNSKRRQELDGFRSTKSWSHVCADAGPVFFVQGVGSPGPALKALEEERTRRLKADQQQSHFMQQLSQQDDSMSGDSLFGPDYFSDRDTLTPLSSASPRLSTTSFPPGPLTPQQQRGSSATWSSRRPESHSPSLALATLSEDRPSGSTLPRGGLGARASRVGTLFGGLHRPRVSNSNFFPQLPPPDLEPVLESLTSVLQQKGSSLDEEQRTVLQQALDTVTDYQTNRAGRPGSLPPTPAHQQQQSGSGIPTSRPSAAAAAAAGTPLGRRTSKMVEVQPDGGLVLRLPGEKGRIEPAKKGTVPESGIVKHSALHEYLTFPCLYMEGLLLKARGKKYVSSHFIISICQFPSPLSLCSSVSIPMFRLFLLWDSSYHRQGLFGSRNLQLRFFVLQGRFLSYFRSKDSRKPNKDISLDMQGRKILVLKHHEFGQNGFQINHANGVPALLLFADTQHIRDVWVSVLQCAAQLPD